MTGAGHVFHDWEMFFVAACELLDPSRFLDRCNALPIVSGRPFGGQIGDPKKIWRTMFAVARASGPRQFGKTQSAQLTNAARDIIPVADPVLLQIGERDGQLAVIFPSVVGMLDFYPIKYAAARQTKNAERGRAQHFNPARRELAVDLVRARFAMFPHATRPFA